MHLSRFKEKNIFCIEGNWNHNLKDKASVKYALDFFEQNSKAKCIHRHCQTQSQFEELVETSLQKTYNKYGIIYIAFHGKPNSVNVGKRTKLDIETIAEIIKGDATDKIIHFGCCSTLDIPMYKLRRFLKKTGALAISGYTEEIDFIQSTCLDILYFKHCQKFRKISAIENEMNKYYRKLINELGFMIKYL